MIYFYLKHHSSRYELQGEYIYLLWYRV